MRFRYGSVVLLLVALVLAPFFRGVAQASPEDTDPQRITDSQSRYALGHMYEQAGDLVTAEAYYKQAIELWPDNLDAKAALQRLIDARTPATPPEPFWAKWLAWLPSVTGEGGTIANLMEVIGWIVTAILFIALFFRFGLETIRLAIRRGRGVPLLGLGQVNDPTGRLPGLPHQLATNMNEAGLTIYDEKGAILPDFNFIGESGFTQAKVLAKLLEMLYARQVQRINVDISLDDGLLNAAVSLVDSGNGYVRYLRVVTVDPTEYRVPGELTRIVARLVADAILISVSRDANTRGLLFQRMGDWTGALKEFMTAADTARKKGICATYYQAHLNLGNLYSFLGLQDKSVVAYNEVAEKAQNPITLALIQAAMACSYRNWRNSSPPDQQGTYEWLARQAIDRALASQKKTPLIAYTIACYYSLSDQIEESLRWLREAVSGDLAYLNYVLTDPDMENLRTWLGDRSPGEGIGLRI
ncbi:MAG TPA: tetratricopeptide repeat protein [Symbiobacteriaceae bacterium]|nr:tetratricopeptide repeat protein [Symbiobacteriaceae bacterium]